MSDSDTSDSSATRADGSAFKRLTVTFENLGIRISGQDSNFGSTCWSVLMEWLTFQRQNGPERVSSAGMCIKAELTVSQYILHDVTGQVNPGEMVNLPLAINHAFANRMMLSSLFLEDRDRVAHLF